jgi:hypothetical protein
MRKININNMGGQLTVVSATKRPPITLEICTAGLKLQGNI